MSGRDRVHFARVKQLLLELADMNATQRTAHLDRECADEPELRLEIDELLEHEESVLLATAHLHDDETIPTGLPMTHPEPIPQSIGHYRVQSILGQGGMGVVYRASDTRLGRDVALKILPNPRTEDMKALEDLRVEARLLAAINHPNIATIFAFEELDGFRFLAMELLEGQTLAKRLRSGPLSVDTTLGVLRQLAAALEAAHARGIVHRDLKPENVIFSGQDQAKVLDFGIATTHDAAASAKSTKATVTGTPGYMSPEQARGQRVDFRTDVWSFGCIAFACLAGGGPFEKDSVIGRIRSTLTEEPNWQRLPSEAPEVVRRLVESCLSKDPDQREASFNDIRRRLESLIADRTMRASQPASAPDSPPTNLPNQLSSFVGRDDARAEVKRLIAQHRLVTLVGFGGTGKTRLAIEAGRSLIDEFSDGVWWVDLTPLRLPERVPELFLAVLGQSAVPDEDPIETLIDTLRERHSIVVLDNCEHLIDAASSLVQKLLEACPHLRVLATSRESLEVYGEAIFHVPQLAYPPKDRDLPLSELAEIESVRLFVDRARGARAEFALTDENAPAVSEICRRLDGIALAIELAAARVNVLQPAAIAEGLDRRFRLLKKGSRTASPHHQTLRALVDWSHDQLSEAEQAMFRRLSVFDGGWTVDPIEQVCAGSPVDEWEALDLLFSLVQRSLVEMDTEAAHGTGHARYRMLETVREYARERLEESDEGASVAGKHRDWVIDIVRYPEKRGMSSNSLEWITLLGNEHDNIRKALATCLEEPNDGAVGLELVFGLISFWGTRGHFREGLSHVQDALAKDTSGRPTHERAAALNGLGNLTFRLGDYETARRHYQQAAEVWEQTGNRVAMSLALGNLSNVAQLEGEADESRLLLNRALRILEKDGRPIEVANAELNLGCLEIFEGKHTDAIPHLTRAIEISEGDDPAIMAYALSSLGSVHRHLGMANARETFEKARAMFAEIGSAEEVVTTTLKISELSLDEGDVARATSEWLEAARELRTLERSRDKDVTLVLARILDASGEDELPVIIRGATAAMTGGEAPVPEEGRPDNMPVEKFAELWARGVSMGWEAAMDLGLTRLGITLS